MYFTVTEDGRGLQKRRYYFSETFAAIGAMELYKATGRKEVLESAEKYFDIAYECYTGVRKNPPKINPETSKMKGLSPVMIMLSTASVMRSGGVNTEKYDKIARESAEEILKGGFLTEHGLLESVSTEGEFKNIPAGRVVNPGHSLECAWFLMQEGVISRNEELINGAIEIIEKTNKLGFDKKHGGIIAFTDCLGYPATALEWDMKLWWPQCEALIAFRLAYMLTGEAKYEKLYLDLLDYTEKNFVDNECGEWYGYLHYDNTPSTTLKGNIFKGPFHIPRFYMIMTLLDEEKSVSEF
jgi:N-acylglucosamine 2-epimerase